jgi:hypothetical protein
MSGLLGQLSPPAWWFRIRARPDQTDQSARIRELEQLLHNETAQVLKLIELHEQQKTILEQIEKLAKAATRGEARNAKDRDP